METPDDFNGFLCGSSTLRCTRGSMAAASFHCQEMNSAGYDQVALTYAQHSARARRSKMWPWVGLMGGKRFRKPDARATRLCGLKDNTVLRDGQ